MAAKKKSKKKVEEIVPEVNDTPDTPKEKNNGGYTMLAGEDAKAHLEADKPKLEVSPPPPVPGRKYSFNQWAASRGKKPHHLAGLRAFCKTVKRARTFEDWDGVFKAY